MEFSWSIDAGSLITAVSAIGGMIVMFTRLSSTMGFVSRQLEDLSDLPEIVARHDERIKNLEYGRKHEIRATK